MILRVTLGIVLLLGKSGFWPKGEIFNVTKGSGICCKQDLGALQRHRTLPREAGLGWWRSSVNPCGIPSVYFHLELLVDVCFSLESTVGIQEFHNVSIYSFVAKKKKKIEAAEHYKGQHKLVICLVIIKRKRRSVLCGYSQALFLAT